MMKKIKSGLVKMALLTAGALACAGCSKTLYEKMDTALRPVDSKNHEIVNYHPGDTIKSKVVKLQSGLLYNIPYTFVRTDDMKGSYETFVDFNGDGILDDYSIWTDESVFEPEVNFNGDDITSMMQENFELYLNHWNLQKEK